MLMCQKAGLSRSAIFYGPHINETRRVVQHLLLFVANGAAELSAQQLTAAEGTFHRSGMVNGGEEVKETMALHEFLISTTNIAAHISEVQEKFETYLAKPRKLLRVPER